MTLRRAVGSVLLGAFGGFLLGVAAGLFVALYLL